MKEKYYIEEVDHEDDNGEEAGISTGKISSDKHKECVIVYGEKYELTQRLIKIVDALNEQN